MGDASANFKGMSLFSQMGERKYLSASERKRFYECLSVILDPAERSFCEMIFWTGCRPSEALSLTPRNIDLGEAAVVIRSLKKRGPLKGRHFRPIPLPRDFIERLESIHNIHAAQNTQTCGSTRIWPFARTKGWMLIKSVMSAAQIEGVRGSARGLRHTMGVHAVMMHVPETRLQSWLGHASRETTAVYISATGPEDRALAKRMWAA